MSPVAGCVGLLLAYRDAARAARAVRSLLDNGVEGVVAWDNSQDGGKTAASLREQFADDGRVHVHECGKNLGFAAGANRGLKLCGTRHPGAWVLLINDDARLLPGGLAVLAQVLSDYPQCAVASPAIDHAGVIRGACHYHRATGLHVPAGFPGSFAYASGCCLMLATERIPSPLFDEDFFMYGEDVELSWRLRGCSGAMRFVERVLVEHEGSASSGLGTDFYETQMVTSHLVLPRKLAESGLARTAFVGMRLMTLGARACVRAIRHGSAVPVTALWRGARTAFCQGSSRL